LVAGFVQTSGPWARSLADARKQWNAHAHQRELPSYTEAKVEEGAYAALLGVAMSADGWREAQAIATDEHFRLRVAELRESRDLRNDDVTMAVIEPYA
jgi:hypothetical protein